MRERKKNPDNETVDSSQQHKLMRTSDIEEFLFANDDDGEKDELDKFCFVDENPDLTKLQAAVVGITRISFIIVLHYIYVALIPWSVGHETTISQHDEEQVQVNHYYMEMPPAKSSSHGPVQGSNTRPSNVISWSWIELLEMTDETYTCHFCEKSFRLKKDLGRYKTSSEHFSSPNWDLTWIDTDAHLYFKPLYNSSPEYFICHHYKCGQKLKTEVSTLLIRYLLTIDQSCLRSHFGWHISSVDQGSASELTTEPFY